MRLQIAIVLFSLAYCRNKHNTEHVEFNRIIPDTSKTWAGRMTQQAFNQTRTFVKTLNLEQLINGTPQEQIRVWYLSGSYDPQVVFILKADSVNKWSLRTISFYRTKCDSIYADYSRVIRQSSIDSLNLNKYWQLASQSDLSKSDTYGCMDGEDVFIEMSNRIKYKFTWYRCPEINKNKDISFHSAAALVNRLDALAVEH